LPGHTLFVAKRLLTLEDTDTEEQTSRFLARSPGLANRPGIVRERPPAVLPWVKQGLFGLLRPEGPAGLRTGQARGARNMTKLEMEAVSLFLGADRVCNHFVRSHVNQHVTASDPSGGIIILSTRPRRAPIEARLNDSRGCASAKSVPVCRLRRQLRSSTATRR
jgi:hypothetical protein